jgi:hypothetical protein
MRIFFSPFPQIDEKCSRKAYHAHRAEVKKSSDSSSSFYAPQLAKIGGPDQTIRIRNSAPLVQSKHLNKKWAAALQTEAVRYMLSEKSRSS